MVNLLGETNAPTKPRQTSTSETLDVFVSSTPSPKTTKTTSPKTIALDLIEVVTPKPKAPTPTPIIPQRNDDVLDAYGSPKTEDENTCPEGYSKNYNRQGKLECLPNYNNDKPEAYFPPNDTPCNLVTDGGLIGISSDGESAKGVFKNGVCVPKDTPITPTQVTKNLKPLIYGVGIIVGIIIISKLLKSN